MDVQDEPSSNLLQRPLHQNRSFMFLWLAQIASQLADRIVFVVFVALIVEYYGSSDSYNSYLYISFTIPAMLLTAIAGVFVDRWPRRATLVMTNVLRAGLVGLLPVLASSGLWYLYGLAFFLSAATQFFVPAEAATIPSIVPKHHLIPANSVFTTTMMASVIFGFALGDPLISSFELSGVHWPLVVLFSLSALLLLGVKVPKQAGELNEELYANQSLGESFKQFGEEIKDGLRFILQNQVIWQSMLKLALMFSAVVAMTILCISFAKSFLYVDPQLAARKFAYIIAISGVGMALGGVLVGNYFHNLPRPWMVYGGASLVGVSLMMLCFVAQFFPDISLIFTELPDIQWGQIDFQPLPVTYRMAYTYFWSFWMGIGASLLTIPLQALLHERIPEDKRGKVMGVQFTILSTCSTLPVLLAGLGADYFGPIPILVTLALPFVVLGLWGLSHQWKRRELGHTSDW